MPTGGGLAFLLVSHLDPSQESLLPELLAPHTALTVVKAATGALIEADRVYVIPPDRYMTVSDGVIRLEKITDPRGARFPIDVLLRSLAADQKENAVGIIFTGTGADGTDGLRAIKGSGGTVIVQDPETVEYQGMPTSAIATGIVDFVLPVEQMPDVLLGYARHFYTSGREPAGEPRAQDVSAELQGVFSVLKARGTRSTTAHTRPGPSFGASIGAWASLRSTRSTTTRRCCGRTRRRSTACVRIFSSRSPTSSATPKGGRS
jgi:two-component system CheB/CheR fusion protein